MIHRVMALAPAIVAGISLLALPAAHAQDVKLPPTMTFTAYDTGTAGFNIAVAVGKMMKDKYGTDLRVLPAGNDVARLSPLRAGRAMSSAMGSGSYFAQEGVFEFGAKEWGPQALQLVLSTVDCNGASLGVAKDTGVKEVKDLKGKRVGFVVGSPALNQNSLAILAFGGLKQSDVKTVEFSSYGAMWKGLSTTTSTPPSRPRSPAPPRKPKPRRAAWSGRRCPTATTPDGNGCRRSDRSSSATWRPAAPALPRTSRSKWEPIRIRSSWSTERNHPTRSTPSPRR